MKKFEIHCADNESYQKRSNSSFWTISIFSILIAGVIIYNGNIVAGLVVGFLIFIFNYFRAYQSAMGYILSISITSEEVELTYNDRDDKKTIKDDIALFKFKKESGFSKTPVFYLSVYYKGDRITKQYE